MIKGGREIMCQIKEASAFSRFLDNIAGVCRLGKTSAPLKRPRKIAGDLPRKRRWKCCARASRGISSLGHHRARND